MFNHNTFHLNDFNRLQVGLRWQKVRQLNRYDFQIVNMDTGAIVREGEAISDDLSRTSNEEVTGSVKYLHDFNDDIMLYASVDRAECQQFREDVWQRCPGQR